MVPDYADRARAKADERRLHCDRRRIDNRALHSVFDESRGTRANRAILPMEAATALVSLTADAIGATEATASCDP